MIFPRLLTLFLIVICAATVSTLKAQESEFIYPTPFFDSWNEVYVAPGGNGWAVGVCDNVVRTADGGRTWTNVSESFVFDRIRSVSCAPGTNCETVFMGINNRMLMSTNGGETWVSHQVNSSRYDFSVPGHIFGYRAGATDLFVSTDGGNNWERTILPDGPEDEIHFVSATEMAYFGDNIFYRSTDGGQTFTSSDPFPARIVLNTRGNDGTYYAEDRNRAIYASADDGATWDTRTTQAHQYTVYKDFWQDAEDSLHIIHFLGIRESSVDGGVTWQRTGNAGVNFNTVRRAEGRIFGAGSLMTAYISDDDWITQDYLFAETRAEFKHFEFADANLAFALADGGEVYRSTDAGRNWELISITGFGDAYQIRVIDANTLVASTQGGGVDISRDGGISWADLPLPNGVQTVGRHAMELGPNNTIYLAARETFLHLQLDGIVLLRNDNPGPELVYSELKFINDQVGFYTASLGLPLWKTTNGGASWTEIPPIANGQTSGISYLHFIDPMNGFTGSGNLQFRTEDGGLTWAFETGVLPPGNNMLEAEDGTLYQHGNQKLYRSTDDGASWSIINELRCSNSVFAAFRPGINQIVGCNSAGFHRFDLDVISPVRETIVAQPLNIYPNPTDGAIQLDLPVTLSREAVVEVFAVNGRRVMSAEVAGTNGQLELSGTAPGIYLVRVVDKGEVWSGRVMVR